MMTIALTGATGFLGLRLVGELLRVHDNIIVLAHAGSEPALDVIARFLASTEAPATLIPSLAERITVVEADLTQRQLGLSSQVFRELADDIDTIWHSAGTVNLEANLEMVRRVNVEGTRRVLELATAGPQPVVVRHISTATVAGAHPAGIVSEDALDGSYGFNNPYEQSKFEVELLVRRWSRTHRASVVVFRPSVLVTDHPAQRGLPGHTLTVVVDIMAGIARRAMSAGTRAGADERTVLRVVGHPRAHMNIIPVECAARAMVRLAAAHGKPRLDTYHIVHPRDVPVATLFAAMERVISIRYALVPELDDPSPLEAALQAYPGLMPYLSYRASFDDTRARTELGAEIVDGELDVNYLAAAMQPVNP
jgi:thioester reductase-like protein